jgi:hypothetical protein
MNRKKTPGKEEAQGLLNPSSFILFSNGRPGGLCHVDGQSAVADSSVAASQSQPTYRVSDQGVVMLHPRPRIRVRTGFQRGDVAVETFPKPATGCHFSRHPFAADSSV